MSSQIIESRYNHDNDGVDHEETPQVNDMKRSDDSFFDKDYDKIPENSEDGQVEHVPKVNRLKKLKKKIVQPYNRLKQSILHEPSDGWAKYSKGLFGCKHNSKLMCFCGSVCPCCIHGVNASDITTGAEGKWERSATGKRVGLYFVLQQAMLCCVCPVCTGSAVRDRIWESATEAGGQTEIQAVRERISMLKDCQIFCAPYLFCPCLAVLQDRRALAKSLVILEEKRRKLNAPKFEMKEVTPIHDDDTVAAKDTNLTKLDDDKKPKSEHEIDEEKKETKTEKK